MASARSFSPGLVLIWSLSVVGPCFGTGLVNVESAILRNRVVVLDGVVMKKALYVAFSLASLESRHGRSEVRGRLTRSGTLLAQASVTLPGHLERSGNLVFDLPYEMEGGKYTISLSAFNDLGSMVASGTRTLDRLELKSAAADARDGADVLPAEVRRAREAEDPLLADALKTRGYVVFARSPLAYVYRESRPKRHEIIEHLSARAVRNAAIVLNFSLYSLRELGRVRLSVSDLDNNGDKLPKKHVRVACVESVPEVAGMPKGQFQLLPTLLRPLTSAEISAHECPRVWITITIPKDAVPGTYAGTLTIAPTNAASTRLPISLAVVPISLEDVPGVDYCMLMTYEFVELTMPWSKEDKSKIYRAATRVLQDYRQSGMTTLCLHSPFVLMTGQDGMPVLDDIFAALRAAHDAGFSRPIIWYMGHLIQTAKPRHPASIRYFNESVQIERLKYLVAKVSNYAKQNGLPEVVFLPIDEPDDSYQDVMNKRASLTPLLVKTIREAGAKSMVTAERYVQSGRPDYLASVQLRTDELKAAHDAGAKYWRYDNRVTRECDSPAYARYQYGFYAWKNKIDGMSSWTFQNTQNAGGVPAEPASSALDVYLAYPAPSGPLATLKWEAVRAGIDDRKLVYQLEKRVTRMKSSGKGTKRYDDFLARMNQMDMESCCNTVSCSRPDGHMLDQARNAIIEMILRADKD